MKTKTLILFLTLTALSLVSLKASILLPSTLSQKEFVDCECKQIKRYGLVNYPFTFVNQHDNELFSHAHDGLYYMYAILASYYHPASPDAEKLLNVETLREYKDQSDAIINEIVLSMAMHFAECTQDFTEEHLKASIEKLTPLAKLAQKEAFIGFSKAGLPNLSDLIKDAHEKEEMIKALFDLSLKSSLK